MRLPPWRLADTLPSVPTHRGATASRAPAARPIAGLAPGQSIEEAIAAFEAGGAPGTVVAPAA